MLNQIRRCLESPVVSPIHRDLVSVEQAKLDLSLQGETLLRFDHEPVRVECRVTRSEFEGWIAQELTEIKTCVEDLLTYTATPASQVDRVFLTGGSSLVPSVRAIFERRFGPERISAGGEFISVATRPEDGKMEPWHPPSRCPP